MHNWNQLQPAVYDGMYKFPSVTATDANGKPTAGPTAPSAKPDTGTDPRFVLPASPCCPKASMWWKWFCLPAMNW
jgi:hypothetical protein